MLFTSKQTKYVINDTDCDEDQRKGLRVWRLWWYFLNREGSAILVLSKPICSGLEATESDLLRSWSSVFRAINVKPQSERIRQKMQHLAERETEGRERKREREPFFFSIFQLRSFKKWIKHIHNKNTGCRRNNSRGKDLRQWKQHVMRPGDFWWKRLFVLYSQERLLQYRSSPKNRLSSFCPVPGAESVQRHYFIK